MRDWQNHSRQATPGKNFPESGMLGPCCVSLDEIAALDDLTLTTRLNGEVMQEGSTSDLIFSPEQLIAYISTFTPLSVGDVLLLGTPAGVGMARTPKRWMKAGDRLSVSVRELGLLDGVVAEES